MNTKTKVQIGAGVATLVTLFLFLRKRASESFAKAAGRSAGEAAIEGLTGVVQGVSDATAGVVDALAGVTPFALRQVKGRALYVTDRNLSRLQGALTEPEGGSSGTYYVEVQNNSDKPLEAVRIELVVDKLGIDPVTELVGVVSIPPFTGVAGQGVVLPRSITGILPIHAKLYANKYFLASIP